MQPLLIQGCSKSKNRPEEAVPALELYSGYFFKIIKKAMRDGDFNERIDLFILSAEHGLIDADTKISWYDREMDSARAEELAPSVRAEIHRRDVDDYDNIVINVGGAYRRTLNGIADSVDTDIHYIEGDGIGYKGQVLKRFIRGESDALTDDSVRTVVSQ